MSARDPRFRELDFAITLQNFGHRGAEPRELWDRRRAIVARAAKQNRLERRRLYLIETQRFDQLREEGLL